MSIYESSITNPKKQLEFYKDLSEQLQRENEILKNNNKTFFIQKEEAYRIADEEYKENQSLKDRIEKAIEYIENSYYSKNTINIDDIAMTTNKCLKIREILKGDK